MSSATPRVKLISIDGLFRQYDHKIKLHLDERVTVLHGRNGVGKTITLKLVAALLRRDYAALARVPFNRLRIDFTDGAFVTVSPHEDERMEAARRRRRGDLLKAAPTGHTPVLRVDYDLSSADVLIDTVGQMGLEEVKISPRSFLYHVDTGEITGLLGLASSLDKAASRKLSFFLLRLRFHFIEAQRLLKIETKDAPFGETTTTVTSVVKDVAAQMASLIQDTDSTYRATATRLDDSLPARLFAPPKNSAKIPKKELARRTEALEAERRRLHEIGLLADTTSFNPSSLNDTQRAMFAVYLQDHEEKLAVFKHLADRAEILLGTLNRKFAPKRITLDKDGGYRVTSHDGRPLDLDHLSSGEQHELVLLHDLLFRVEEGALLLIDEPELSLHVTWQDEFLEELIQIAKLVGFDAIVATHSPYIVGERRDLMVRLGEPV